MNAYAKNINLTSKLTRLICPLAIIGSISLVACTSSETVGEPAGQEQQQTSISFSGSKPQGEAISRADKGLEEVLDNKSFKVWSYKNTAATGDDYTTYQLVMSGYTVDYETDITSVSNTHDWEYVGRGTNQTIKYWDFAAYAYRFFAYALGNATADPATTPATVTEDNTDDTKVTFTAAVDASSEATINAAPYFSELWFSTDKANAYGKVVTLRFLKPFARVRFLFQYSEGLDFGREELRHIRFAPTPTGSGTAPTIATAGNISVSYPLKGTETKESWSSVTTGSIPAFTEDEKWYDVMPASSQGTYTIQVAIVTDEVKEATVPADYMSWKPGFEYTYVFKITEQGGLTLDVIQVAINSWVEKGPITHPVYNW